MRKYILASLVLLPLVFSPSHAAQMWAVDPPSPLLGFPSEESGTGAYLGVDVSDVTTERLSALKLKEEKGVEVTMVDQDAPAGKAGIREHDVILAMNGTTLESGAQLRRMIRETPPGRVVTLGLSRDGQPLTVQVQLGDRRKEFAYTPNVKQFTVQVPPVHFPQFEMPEVNVVVVRSSARSGLMVENLTPQLGEFFGVKDGHGVLIRSVEKGSRGEKAGLRAGDVIVKVNDQPIHDTSDFTHALRPSGGSISVGVIRDRKEQNFNLTLPERKDSGELYEEESFDDEPLDADSYADLAELQDQVAQLQPSIELSSEEARKASKEVEKATREARKALCAEQRQARKEAEKMRGKLALDQEKMKKEQEKMLDELQKMQIEIQHRWADI